MSHRRFTDEDGRRWEVRVSAKGDWRFIPVPGNPSSPLVGEPPLHATDPFEVSEGELRSVLDGAVAESPRQRPGAARDRAAAGLFGEPPAASRKKSPFRDDAPSERRNPSFRDEAGGKKKKRSPFLDDREDG